MYVDTGLLVATRGLLASSPAHTRGPINQVKALAKQVPSTRENVGPLLLGETSTEVDEDKAKVAASFWSKVWQERPSPPPLASRANFLNGYNKNVDQTSCLQPSLENVLAAIKATNNSSPGPDGIPVSAWRSAPDLAAPVLFGVLKALCIG